MDLCALRSAFNLANSQWPILPQVRARPPEPVRDRSGRAGRVVSSLVSSGANVSGGLVGESVLARGVRVGEGASVVRAVLLHYARIGPRAVIRHAMSQRMRRRDGLTGSGRWVPGRRQGCTRGCRRANRRRVRVRLRP